MLQIFFRQSISLCSLYRLELPKSIFLLFYAEISSILPYTSMRKTFCTFRILLVLKLHIPAPRISIKKHNIIDRYIGYLAFLHYIPFIRYNKRFLDVIIFILHKSIERTVDSIVLSYYNIFRR